MYWASVPNEYSCVVSLAYPTPLLHNISIDSLILECVLLCSSRLARIISSNGLLRLRPLINTPYLNTSHLRPACLQNKTQCFDAKPFEVINEHWLCLACGYIVSYYPGWLCVPWAMKSTNLGNCCSKHDRLKLRSVPPLLLKPWVTQQALFDIREQPFIHRSFYK